MTDTTQVVTTPAQAATPEPQAGEGKERQEHPNAEAQTPEQLQDELQKKNREARNLRDRLKAAEDKLTATEKATAAAEAKRLAEQGEYKSLYESVKAKADAADALQERLDAITAQALSLIHI